VEVDLVPEALLETDDLPFSDPQEHHHMSRWKAARVNVFSWLKQKVTDPATEVSALCILSRILSLTVHTGILSEACQSFPGSTSP
jgi:hypothetical protein